MWRKLQAAITMSEYYRRLTVLLNDERERERERGREIERERKRVTFVSKELRFFICVFSSKPITSSFSLLASFSCES